MESKLRLPTPCAYQLPADPWGGPAFSFSKGAGHKTPHGDSSRGVAIP